MRLDLMLLCGSCTQVTCQTSLTMSDCLPILTPPVFEANFGFAAPVCRLAVRLIRGDKAGLVVDPSVMRSFMYLGFLWTHITMVLNLFAVRPSKSSLISPGQFDHGQNEQQGSG
jgi:hypothetical protein